MLADSVLTQEAHKALEDAILYYRGKPIGTVAACDPDAEAVNYDQCLVRDLCVFCFVLSHAGQARYRS